MLSLKHSIPRALGKRRGNGRPGGTYQLREELLALQTQQGPGDLHLERFELESNPIAEIAEGPERL